MEALQAEIGTNIIGREMWLKISLDIVFSALIGLGYLWQEGKILTTEKIDSYAPNPNELRYASTLTTSENTTKSV